jgi:hypothetical protein
VLLFRYYVPFWKINFRIIGRRKCCSTRKLSRHILTIFVKHVYTCKKYEENKKHNNNLEILFKFSLGYLMIIVTDALYESKGSLLVLMWHNIWPLRVYRLHCFSACCVQPSKAYTLTCRSIIIWRDRYMRSSIKGGIFYLQSVQASKVDRIYLVLHIVFLSDYLSWGFLNYGCKILVKWNLIFCMQIDQRDVTVKHTEK